MDYYARKPKFGKWKMMEHPIPEALAVELNKACPNFQAVQEDFLRELRKVYEVVNGALHRYVDFILQQAQLKGINLSVRHSCCHRPTCMTCLGKYPTHYPYFRVIDKERPLIEGRKGLYRYIKPRETRRIVKKRELFDFLRKLDMDEDRIKRFIALCDLRDYIVQLYHSVILTFNWMGLSELRLVEPEEDREIEV